MRYPHITTAIFALLLLPLAGAGCSDAGEPVAAEDDLALDLGPEDPESGKAFFDPALPTGGKEDSVLGRKGISTAYDNGPAAVWEVRNAWADTNTAEARRAGMAWPANSGLTWDEKFALWVQSLPKEDAHFRGSTFAVTTPYGKTLPGPALECAEVTMFLRASFASWYGLPFFVEASDAGRRIYLGHFGFLYEDGTRYRTTPNFKTAYRDHSDRAETWQTAGWPEDSTLRGRRLGGSQDDFQPALFEGARAGAYFDALYLNKRTGYFMILLLSYFGSINLASTANTFNLAPAAIRAGDTLVQRWQRQGIGHVYVVKRVDDLGEGIISAEVVSGSMPRRQPVWETPAASQSAFTAESSGGPGTNSDGEVHAALGGGLKRWRTPVNQGGHWTNIVPVADRGAFVDASNLDAVGARIEAFRGILGALTPQERVDTLLGQIESARAHLRRFPASCAARTRREQAFDKLYTVLSEEFGMDTAEVDRQYRLLEDYVLAELIYNQSRTCCWNSSTSAMFEIILDKAMADEASWDGTCHAPEVFKVTEGGFESFRAHAALIGREAEWRPWSADERCPQAGTDEDVIAESLATPYCEIAAFIDEEGADVLPGHDAFEPNDTASTAAEIPLGQAIEAVIAEGDVDFFAVTIPAHGRLTVTLDFIHAEGDLDLVLQDEAGRGLGNSAGTSDREEISLSRVEPGRIIIKVHLYGRSPGNQGYSLTTTFEEAASTQPLGADRFEPNDTPEEAALISFGVHEDLTHCGDKDYYAFDVDGGRAVELAIDFMHAEGDLDLRLLTPSMGQLASANGTGDRESITRDLSPGRYLIEVIRFRSEGYDGNCQPYTLSLLSR